ncbi:MAG: PaaI family thioesterase [Rhodobacteraceae bacterium]|nr:PaaI family thioesterase [Paracoccaceae bacterium]PHR53927.1 MAG: thioesterase [Robiginitomaculum sp.]
MNHIGPILQSNKKDSGRIFALQMRDAHKNRLGIIHGGAIASFLDQVMAIEAWEMVDRRPTVTVQMDIRFIGAAKIGDFIEARAGVKHATGSMLFVDADVYCGATSIASASAIMKIVRKAG